MGKHPHIIFIEFRVLGRPSPQTARGVLGQRRAPIDRGLDRPHRLARLTPAPEAVDAPGPDAQLVVGLGLAGSVADAVRAVVVPQPVRDPADGARLHGPGS